MVFSSSGLVACACVLSTASSLPAAGQAKETAVKQAANVLQHLRQAQKHGIQEYFRQAMREAELSLAAKHLQTSVVPHRTLES